jgi:hypothetical protein
MTPTLYDIHETAPLVRHSVSWLYRHAGIDIPVTRIAGSNRLFWTDEQIGQIIRDGAQPAKAAKRTPQKGRPAARPAKLAAVPQPSEVKIPQARPERSRRYRPGSAA